MQDYASLQAELDRIREAGKGKKTTKEIKSKIKALERAQVELWLKEHGPNLGLLEILFFLD